MTAETASDGLTRGQVPWARIRVALRQWYGDDRAMYCTLYDLAGGRSGASGTSLVRQVAARLRTLDTDLTVRRDGLADTLDKLADWHDQHPSDDGITFAADIVRAIRARIPAWCEHREGDLWNWAWGERHISVDGRVRIYPLATAQHRGPLVVGSDSRHIVSVELPHVCARDDTARVLAVLEAADILPASNGDLA